MTIPVYQVTSLSCFKRWLTASNLPMHWSQTQAGSTGKKPQRSLRIPTARAGLRLFVSPMRPTACATGRWLRKHVSAVGKLSLSVSQSIRPSVSLSVSQAHSVCPSTRPPIRLSAVASQSWNHSIYRAVCLLYLSVCLSIYLSIYLSIHLSIYLSIYLPVCLSACLSDR